MPEFARAPRRAKAGHGRQTFLLLREIVADERFAGLPARTQSVVLTAVIQHADGEGKFWPKARKLGELVGRTDRSVRDALDQAVASGLLTKQGYLRPDGKRGSNTYQVDAVLVTRAEETFLACGNRKESSYGQNRKKPSYGQDRKRPSELNEILNEISEREGQPLTDDQKTGFVLCAFENCTRKRRGGSSFCQGHGKEANRTLRVVLKPVADEEHAA